MHTQPVLEAVCTVFGLTMAELTGPRRRRNEADARKCAAWILYTNSRMSNDQIGEAMSRAGNTVVHFRNGHAELYRCDQQYRKLVNQVLALLGLTELAEAAA